MAPFEALYGRRCTSYIGWFEVGEVDLIGPELVHLIGTSSIDNKTRVVKFHFGNEIVL